MSKTLLFSFLMLALTVTACQPKSSESTDEVSQIEEGVVSLASEVNMGQPLGAQFSSKNGTFSYALTYDGALMTLMESADASVPYFEISGGSTLRMETDWVATVADDAEMADAPVKVGAYEVYQFMDSEGTCSLDVTLVPYSEEVLRVTLKVCEGNDGDLGREALGQLLENLQIQAL